MQNASDDDDGLAVLTDPERKILNRGPKIKRSQDSLTCILSP
jgi:hypothetical protein